MKYAIEFNYPEGDILYAGFAKGALGWAYTLETALLFDTEEIAEAHLSNGYGASKVFGRIIKVDDENPS